MTIEQAQGMLNRAADYCGYNNALYSHDVWLLDPVLANGYADAALLLQEYADALEFELLAQDWKQERNTEGC